MPTLTFLFGAPLFTWHFFGSFFLEFKLKNYSDIQKYYEVLVRQVNLRVVSLKKNSFGMHRSVEHLVA